jgi:endonuclease/exonuclease/phosphatase (EEP) superfamily protein YafD
LQCEWATHFQLQYVVLLGIIALIFALDGRVRWATYAMVVAVAAFSYHLLPLYFGPSPPAVEQRALRLVSANLAFFNQSKPAFIDFVRAEKPDVILLFEVTKEWSEVLSKLDAEYPHRKMLTHEWRDGIAVFSKFASDDMRIDTIGKSPIAVIVGTLKLPGEKQLTLVGAHPESPIRWADTLHRNDQIAELAKLVSSLPQPLVLAGDLNTSGWNPVFKQLLFATGLRDSRLGFGIQSTWNMMRPLIRTPIDHCLVSPQVQVLDRRTGTYFGSDHLPIIVDLQTR